MGSGRVAALKRTARSSLGEEYSSCMIIGIDGGAPFSVLFAGLRQAQPANREAPMCAQWSARSCDSAPAGLGSTIQWADQYRETPVGTAEDLLRVLGRSSTNSLRHEAFPSAVYPQRCTSQLFRMGSNPAVQRNDVRVNVQVWTKSYPRVKMFGTVPRDTLLHANLGTIAGAALKRCKMQRNL